MSNIVTFSNANLPAVASLSTALRSLERDVGSAGVVLLKMDKTGHWVFGADQTEVEDDSTWAVNPFSFVHGYIAWGDGEVLGEKMVSVSQPLPELDAAPPNAKRGWETQIGMSLKCLSGEDKDMEARYSTTSVGGKRSVQALALAIATQVEKDQSKPVPVVRLKRDHYTHKSYGKIFTPVFEILEWISVTGESAETPEEEPTERRRRRPV
ncbi:MAG: hypothetical protein ACO377_12660 [Pseudomonadales bacterium]|jgi:hypothetical protein